MNDGTHAPTGILFGAAYYAEYHQEERTKVDLDLMVEAGMNVIRVGESVWSTWEPADGRFDLDWLEPVLDGAHERDISVILGTPTYAVPPWLQQSYPEIAAERRTGQPIPWGARQEVDFTHPAFRFHAERVVRAILRRYADHPAIIGYQVDNEPGLELFHNRATFQRFVRRLADRYGDVETLNREWGLTYWSHRIGDWSQLWTPDGNTLPQYDLAWRRFQADLTTEFIAWQADLVRGYARSDQFVTTCIAYPRPAVDDEKLVAALDITAGNPYYAMQDHLDATLEPPALSPWTTSGVAGLFRQADRLYSSKQARFLVTETDAQSIGGAELNLPPYPGQLAQAAFALIARGAAMIEYWHWHTLPYGTETYWGGVLPHSLQPGRIYREASELGTRLRAIGGALDGFEPDADVAVLWSNDTRFAFEFTPPLSDSSGAADPRSYERIVDAFYRGVLDAGCQARILHLEQAHASGADELARLYPVLIAPAVYVASDADLDLLRDYAAAGGRLVIGVRTGYADEEARARVEVAPARLADAAGVHYSEFSNLHHPVPVQGPGLGADDAGTFWADGLVVDDATVLAHYEHPFLQTFPAITRRTFGAGSITVVGTVPSATLASGVVAALVQTPIADRLVPGRELPVQVASGRTAGGARAWFVFNWSWEPRSIELAADVTDLTTGERILAGTSLSLPGWSVQTWTQT